MTPQSWPFITPRRAPVSTLQTLKAPSWAPVTTVVPSAPNAIALMLLECLTVRSSLASATSHILSVPSQPPVAAIAPSRETATVITFAPWPTNRRTGAKVVRSHRITLLSSLAVSASRPLGRNATALTGPKCSLNSAISVCSTKSHSLAV